MAKTFPTYRHLQAIFVAVGAALLAPGSVLRCVHASPETQESLRLLSNDMEQQTHAMRNLQAKMADHKTQLRNMQLALDKALQTFSTGNEAQKRCFAAHSPLHHSAGVPIRIHQEGASTPIPPFLAPANSPLSPDALHAAAARGDAEKLHQLLIGGVDAHARDTHGDTALHIAAQAGHLESIETLLWFGADPRSRGQRMRSPLHCAAAHGHLMGVQRLLEAGAQLHAKDVDGATALELADQRNHTDVFEFLILKDASVEYVNAEGDSALLSVVRKRQWALAKKLIERGASPIEKGDDGASPLYVVARDGHVDVLKAMLQHGAVCDVLELQRALVAANGADVVWELLEAAPEMVAVASAGQMALRRAAHEGRLEALVALLNAGVNPTAADEESNTAMHFAAKQQDINCMIALRQHGAERPSSPRLEQELRKEAELGLRENVTYLLSAGVPPDAKDSNGRTALALASQKGHADCAQELLKSGADKNIRICGWNNKTSLIIAAEYGRVEAVLALLSVGADVNIKDSDGNSALMFAATGGHLEIVKALIEKDAKITDKNKYGHNALAWASKNGHIAVVNILLQAGADPNVKDFSGQRPIHVAAGYGHLPVARDLLKAGADVTATRHDGATALHLAAWKGHAGIVRLLLEKGARREQKTNEGQTALNVATSDEVRRLLKV